jgi:2-hydroxy-3-oxopropionate reductase
MRTVGLIGLGLLGQAFAERLLAAGYPVLGTDIEASKSEQLTAVGGTATSDLHAIAKTCGVIILAVFNTEQVESVTETVLLKNAPAGARPIVLCTSTCDPDRTAALAARIGDDRLRFLETPVSGTSAQVRAGAGVGLIAGDSIAIQEAQPILDTLFPRNFFVGRIGDAGRSKLAINLVLGLNRLALAEGLAFAECVGLDLQSLFPVLRESAAYSQVMDTKGVKMVQSDFAPEGRARQTLKDAHLMLEQGMKAGQPLPALEVHVDVLEACVRHGQGDMDNSVIIDELRRRRQ